MLAIQDSLFKFLLSKSFEEEGKSSDGWVLLAVTKYCTDSQRRHVAATSRMQAPDPSSFPSSYCCDGITSSTCDYWLSLH